VIPAGFLQELLGRVDIVDVVGPHVALKRGGANYMGLCPFHGEKSPSFSVSPSKQFYYCFGCGASGDAIRFLTEHLGLSFVDAVRDLAGRVGLQVPEEQVSPAEREQRATLRERRQSLAGVLDRAATFYREQLRANARAIDYLKRRGLTGAVAARFGLGFAPPGWRTLAGVFPRYDDPLLEEAGLVRQTADEAGTDRGGGGDGTSTDGSRGRYDWFRDRVMFPIRALDGQVIGFGGRVLDDSKPKYINSPETPLFSKGRELYGLFEARQAVRERGFVLVVEGYMDVVALAQSGLPNAVATLGTACTDEHVHKLFRHTDAVVFAFDGDAAGRRAAARALEASLPHAGDLRSVRFLFLPPEHDPDSYVRALGPQAFEAAVAQAVPLSRQLLEQAAAGCDLGHAEGRARMLAQARPLWEALPEGALRTQLLAELAHQGRIGAAELAALWATPGAGPGGAAHRGAAGGVGGGDGGGGGGGRASAAAAARAGGAAGRPPLPPLPRLQAPRARDGRARAAPPGLADLALRLLLRHSAWWEQLGADDQQLLHELGGAHGRALAWIEQQVVEHGPQPASALLRAARDGQGLGDGDDDLRELLARGLQDGEGAPDDSPEDLLRVLQRLRLARLSDEAALLAAQAEHDPQAQAEYALCLRRVRDLKAALAEAPQPPAPV
jgi:DNA primase